MSPRRADAAQEWTVGAGIAGRGLRIERMQSDVPAQLVALLPRLRRFAYSLTGSLDEADDIVQSACERALGRLDQFVPGTRLDSWMYRIAQTVWIDRTRYAGRRRETSAAEVLEALPFDARIHEGAAARADLAVVRAEIAKLPEEQRLVLALVTIDGRSYQEAADMLGVPVGTIMSRLARARYRLAQAIEFPRPKPRQGGMGAT